MNPAQNGGRKESPALLWLIVGCLSLQPLSTDFYVASLPYLADYFSASPAAAQQTLSAFALGFAVAQLLTGPLSDRYGRRPVLLAGLAVYVLGSLACAVSPTISLLVAARLAQAVGCCTAVVVVRAIVRDAYSVSDGAHVIARATSLFALVPLLSPIAGGYLQTFFGWRASFIAQFVAAALLMLATFLRLPETGTQRRGRSSTGVVADYVHIARHPKFWAYALPGMLSFCSIFIFISGASFVLIDVLHIPTQYVGYCFAVGGIGYLLGTLTCRKLLHHLGVVRSIDLGCVLGLAAGLLFLLAVAAGAEHWASVVAAHFLVMFAHAIVFTCAQIGAVAPFPQRAGAAVALLGCLAMLAALLVGTVVGISHDGSLRPLSIISASVALTLFLCSRLFARHRTQPSD